jgi:WD40 repeat protein
MGEDSTIRFLQPSTAIEDGKTQSLSLGIRPGEHGKLLSIPTSSVRTSSGPERLAVLSPDGLEIRIVPDPWTEHTVTVTRGHDAQIHLALASDPKYKKLAAGGMEKTIALWDVSAPQQSPRILRGHKGAVTGLAFTGDGKRLASCGADGTVRLWDVEQGLELLTLRGYDDASAILFRHPKKAWDEMGLEGMYNMLAIAHGNKVSLLAPH